MTVSIQELTRATEQATKQINGLLSQLSKDPQYLPMWRLNQIARSCTSRLFVAMDEGNVVGCLVLHYPDMLTEGKAWTDDLVVDEDYRRQGVARRLMVAAIEAAFEDGMRSVNGTTSRVASQELVKQLGFYQRDSVLIRKDL